VFIISLSDYFFRFLGTDFIFITAARLLPQGNTTQDEFPNHDLYSFISQTATNCPRKWLTALGDEIRLMDNAMKAPTLTLHGSYIRALNIILKFSKLLLEVIK
jgi:hypothetical protein